MESAIRLAPSQKMALALFAIALLFNSANAQKKPDKDNENLLGPVKSVQSELLDFDPQDPGRIIRTKQRDIVTYDTKGNEIERTIYDTYGFFAAKQRYSYDANGNLTDSAMYDEKGVIMERQAYTYTNGNLTQIAGTDAAGAASYKEVHSYDDKGRIRESTHSIQNKTFGKTVYKYDQKGNLSEVAFYTPEGTKADAPIGPCSGAHRITYTYDTTNKPVQIVSFETDGKQQRSWNYTYDSKGQLAKDVRDSEFSRTTYTYTYEYDPHGNWTKQFGTAQTQPKTFDDKPHERKTVISRKITYY